MPGALATEGGDAHVYGHLGGLVLVFASIARILKWVPPGFARHEGGKRDGRVSLDGGSLALGAGGGVSVYLLSLHFTFFWSPPHPHLVSYTTGTLFTLSRSE
jgi:hypothetical protein